MCTSAIFCLFRADDLYSLEGFIVVGFRPILFCFVIEYPKNQNNWKNYQFFWIKLWLCQWPKCLKPFESWSSLKNLFSYIFIFSAAPLRENYSKNIKWTFLHHPNTSFSEKSMKINRSTCNNVFALFFVNFIYFVKAAASYHIFFYIY